MSKMWLQGGWNEFLKKRPDVTKGEQLLLWVVEIGLVVNVVLCTAIALYASPTVLSDHPWLQAYVDFMEGIFVAIDRLSVGALHPQVSKLMFAVGCAIGLVQFIALMMQIIIYVLLLDYKGARAAYERAYASSPNIVRGGVVTRVIEITGGPIVIALIAAFVLGELGFIHFGYINGYTLSKENNLRHTYIDMFFMNMYTSRFGLAVVGSLSIFIGLLECPMILIVVFFVLPHWVSLMRQRRVSGFVLGPVILLSLFVFSAAIALELNKKREEETNSAITEYIPQHNAAPTSATTNAGNDLPSGQKLQDISCNGLGPMRMPRSPSTFRGTALGQASTHEALAAIHQGEKRVNGQLDAEYLYSPRVVIQPDVLPDGEEVMAVIPQSMTVKPGQHIVYATGYADSRNPCHYFPNVVVRVE